MSLTASQTRLLRKAAGHLSGVFILSYEDGKRPESYMVVQSLCCQNPPLLKFVNSFTNWHREPGSRQTKIFMTLVYRITDEGRKALAEGR